MFAVKLLRPCTLLKLQSLSRYQICKQYMTAVSCLFLCSQFFSSSLRILYTMSAIQKRLRGKPDEFQLRCNDSAKSNAWKIFSFVRDLPRLRLHYLPLHRNTKFMKLPHQFIRVGSQIYSSAAGRVGSGQKNSDPCPTLLHQGNPFRNL